MKKVLGLFFAIMFVIGTDTFIVGPLLPELRTAYGISVERSGWIVSAYALGYALFALVAGPLSDGWNRKAVLLCGLSGFAVSTLLCGTAGSFGTMVLFRFLAGVSAAFATPQIWAAIPQLVPPAAIVKSMGRVTAGLAAAQLLGVPLGSWLASRDWSTPFVVVGCAALLLVGVSAKVVPSMPPRPAANGGPAPSIAARYRALLGERKAALAFAAYFTFQLGNFAAFSFIGTWLADAFDMSVARIGTVIMFLGFGNMTSNLFSGRLIHKIGIGRTLIGGLAILAPFYIAVSLLDRPVWVDAAFFLIYFVAGAVFPVMMALLQSLSAESRGTIASLANSAMYAGTTLGSLAAGLLYGKLGGYLAVCVFTSVCFICAGLLFARSGVLPGHRRSAAGTGGLAAGTERADG